MGVLEHEDDQRDGDQRAGADGDPGAAGARAAHSLTCLSGGGRRARRPGRRLTRGGRGNGALVGGGVENGHGVLRSAAVVVRWAPTGSVSLIPDAGNRTRAQGAATGDFGPAAGSQSSLLRASGAAW